MSSLLNYDSMNLGSVNETLPKLETDFGDGQGVEKMIPTWYQQQVPPGSVRKVCSKCDCTSRERE